MCLHLFTKTMKKNKTDIEEATILFILGLMMVANEETTSVGF